MHDEINSMYTIKCNTFKKKIHNSNEKLDHLTNLLTAIQNYM